METELDLGDRSMRFGVKRDPALCGCDRITSEMRGLSPKIISGDSRRSENTQMQYISIQYHDIQVIKKLLHIKCHVLGSYNRQSPKCASKDGQSFCKSVRFVR